MTLIDAKGRLFGLINVIDLLVVLLVLGVGGQYAYSKLVSRQAALVQQKERTMQVTAVLSAVRQASIDALHVGDRVWETKSRAYLGEVVKLEAKPADIVYIGPDGRMTETTSQTRYDLYVTIRGRGRVAENVITLGGIELRVGTTLPLYTAEYSGTSVVHAIDRGAP